MKKWACLIVAMLTLMTMSAQAEEAVSQKTDVPAPSEVDARTFVISATTPTIDYVNIGIELGNIEEALKIGNVDSKTISQYVSYLGTASGQLQELR